MITSELTFFTQRVKEGGAITWKTVHILGWEYFPVCSASSLKGARKRWKSEIVQGNGISAFKERLQCLGKVHLIARGKRGRVIGISK